MCETCLGKDINLSYLVHKGHLCVVRLIDLECLPILFELNAIIKKFIVQLTSSHTEYSGKCAWYVFHIDGKCGQ